MHTFVIFLKAVAYQWWTFGAFVSTVVAIVGIWWNKPFGVSRKWFWRIAFALWFLASYAAWRDEYWSTQGWIGANKDKQGKIQEMAKKNDELTDRNGALVSQVGTLQVQLAARQKSVTLQSAPAPRVTQQSSGNYSPNTSIIGNQNQVTIDTAPPARKLTDQQVVMLKQYAALCPAKIRIYYQSGDLEGYALAKQIGDALEQVGWTLSQPINGVMTISQVPTVGLSIGWKGNPVPPRTNIFLEANTPQGVLAGVLNIALPGELTVNPSPDLDPGLVTLDVYTNPKVAPHP
jgi:hypothetical protein